MYSITDVINRLPLTATDFEKIHIWNIPSRANIAMGWAYRKNILILTSGNIPKTDRMILHEHYHTVDPDDYSSLNQKEQIIHREANAELYALQGFLK